MASAKDPTVNEAVKAMEAVKADVAATATQAVRAAEHPLAIHNDPQGEIVKGNQRESSAWLQSPSYLTLLSVATGRLHTVAGEKDPVTRVHKVRASRLQGQSKIYIYKTDKEDLKGIPVNYSKGTASINLISLLAPSNQRVPSGYRYAYEIRFAEATDPFYPALVLDISAPVEKKLMRRHRAMAPAARADTE